MKRIVLAFSLPLVLAASVAYAQKPATVGRSGLDTVTSVGDLKTTPEMWFYEQAMRQYKDPKAAVRAKAEVYAAQRARRLESMRWFGFSNSRPRVSSDPIHGDYSPRWVANAGCFPSRWSGMGMP
jgi:hypothetical protein